MWAGRPLRPQAGRTAHRPQMATAPWRPAAGGDTVGVMPLLPTDQPPVRLSTGGDVAAVLPLLCGFQPTESLLLVLLHPPRDRIELKVRVDLPARGEDGPLVADLVSYAVRCGAPAALVAVFTEARQHRPRRRLVTALRAALAGESVAVRDALLIRDGRWLSYFCTDGRCCPDTGSPIPPPDPRMVLLSAASGRAVLPDRAALVASIAAPTGATAATMTRLIREARRCPPPHGLGVLRAAIADNAAGLRLEDAAVAACVAALDDLLVRDTLLADAADDVGCEALLPFLIALAARTPPPVDAQVTAVLATVAYCSGDGSLANVALVRTFATDPHHSLARLVWTMLTSLIPPQAVRASLASSGAETRRLLAERDQAPGGAFPAGVPELPHDGIGRPSGPGDPRRDG